MMLSSFANLLDIFVSTGIRMLCPSYVRGRTLTNDVFRNCFECLLVVGDLSTLCLYMYKKNLSSLREIRSFHFSNIVTPFPSS